MTPKQVERIQGKIKKLKAALSRDKRQWGGYYHDGKGLRYLIPRLYLQLRDYKGGQRYFNWFHKEFPDDSGYPDFMFEWSVILFMNGKTRDAEKKLFEAYCRNTYIIDKFIGKEIIPIEKWEGSNLEDAEFVNHFNYSSKDEDLTSFSEWLTGIVASEKFIRATEKYIETEKKLLHEKDYATRCLLVEQQRQLINTY